MLVEFWHIVLRPVGFGQSQLVSKEESSVPMQFRNLVPVGALLAIGLAFVIPGAVRAQQINRVPDTPQLNSVNPPSAVRGGTVTLTLGGSQLEGARNLMCRYSARPGRIPMADVGLQAKVIKSSDGQIQATVIIPPTAPPGLHEIRALCRDGISDGIYFYIGQYKQTNEKEPNNALAQAQALTLPTEVAGTINRGEDRDVYSFKANAGETIIFEVDSFHRFAGRQDRNQGFTYLDPFISLQDAAGKELAYSDDKFRLDPFIAHKFATAGTYHIVIRDDLYRGRGDFNYRLTVAQRPTITAVFPPSGKAGARGVATVYGYNLNAAGATEMRRRITYPSRPGMGEFRITTPAGTSNAFPISAGTLLEAAEKEPNDRIQSASMYVLPITFTGKFDKFGDVDGYRFQAQARQQLVFQVEAQSLGSPVDTFITVTDRSGRVIGSNDDNGTNRDSRLQVTMPRTDEYAVFIHNNTQTGVGPDQYYRLTVRPTKPSYSYSIQLPGRDRRGRPRDVTVPGITVPQGGYKEFKLQIARREGHRGDLILELSPPPTLRGLSIVPVKVTKMPDPDGGPDIETRELGKGPIIAKGGSTSANVAIKADKTVPMGNYIRVVMILKGEAGNQLGNVRQYLWVTVGPAEEE